MVIFPMFPQNSPKSPASTPRLPGLGQILGSQGAHLCYVWLEGEVRKTNTTNLIKNKTMDFKNKQTLELLRNYG